MERRKILLGSGAALATVLAGCSSSETDEENPDDGEESLGDEPDSDSEDESDTDSEDGDDSYDDVPGFDHDTLTVSSDHLTVTGIEHNGDRATVIADSEITDRNALYSELEVLAEDLAAAVTDSEAFTEEISRVEWVLEHDGNQLLTFYAEVEWILEYIGEEITKDELVSRMLETKE
ncbi:hypothetical protein [Halopiger djelfimassiliensis]|uniref:hypothetical protein n=1 Tax=Halopiger djelfimassiliensis TaxID=1293047 RepID=UPI000677FFA4|nr:hypothetical protein [Halopiger djelfimassiliensis]